MDQKWFTLLATYALFMKNMNSMVDGQPFIREESSMPLMSISPISKGDDESEIESPHAIAFDASTHVRLLEHIVLFVKLPTAAH